MSIETVLSWQAFADQSPNLDLKGLLVRDDIGGQTESSLNTDFMQQTGYEDDLLQRFLDNVFIYNPVLEEAVLQQYIREVQFHGLKWDAKSCLLVGRITWSQSGEIADPYSFSSTPTAA